MSELTQITDLQQASIDVLRMLNSEIASSKKAMVFIGDSKLKFELFRDSYYETQPGSDQAPLSPSSISARVDVAIQSAEQKLTIFQL